MKTSRRIQYENNRRKRRRRVIRLKIIIVAMGIVVLLLVLHIIFSLLMLVGDTMDHQKFEIESGKIAYEDYEPYVEDDIDEEDAPSSQEELSSIEIKLKNFAEENDFSVSEYPEELLELLEKNPETEEFVLNYSLKKGTYSIEGLDAYLNQTQVPLFLQWDSRWGYYEYGGGLLGMTGCGPTCLSMVAVHLLQNPQMTPIYMADYAQKNGYYVQGTGTAWTFMSQGASAFGLRAQEVSLDEELVMRYLQQGKPIICAMGPGDFTENGHFIVLIGVEDGKLVVNDPNSRENSEKLWSFEKIKYQIRNMWAYSVW